VQVRRTGQRCRLEIVCWRGSRSSNWKAAASRMPGAVILRELDSAIDVVSRIRGANPAGAATNAQRRQSPGKQPRAAPGLDASQRGAVCSNCRRGPEHSSAECPSPTCGHWLRTGDCAFGSNCFRAASHTRTNQGALRQPASLGEGAAHSSFSGSTCKRS
jgi:hypothetical protein